MKRVGIIAAWEPEMLGVRRRLPSVEHIAIGGWAFDVHRLGNMEIVSVVSGVGKVLCASCTQLLISRFSLDEMYMTGICGGLRDEWAGIEIAVFERALQHDVESPGIHGDPFNLYKGRSSFYESDPGLLDRFRDFSATMIRTRLGLVVSGDQRIRNAKRRDFLRQEFGAIAVDQEFAAFAHVCTLNRVPFMGLKAVSDCADEHTEQYQKLHKLKACDVASNTLIDFLDALQRGEGGDC